MVVLRTMMQNQDRRWLGQFGARSIRGTNANSMLLPIIAFVSGVKIARRFVLITHTLFWALMSVVAVAGGHVGTLW